MFVFSRLNFNKLIVLFVLDKVFKLVDVVLKVVGLVVNQLFGIKGVLVEMVGWEMGLCDV